MLQTVNCDAGIKETVPEDRISALPEDLLVMILDLVPTKDAVATMFLSKRWFSVWTMKQRLEYKDTIEEEEDSDDDDDYAYKHVDDDEHEHEHEHDEKVVEVESKKSVWWFLENSLQLHRAPVIRSLCIELGPSCPTDADVGKWVANAVDRRVLEIKLKLLWSADPASLPNTLYSCKSLVVLTLSDNILVDVPSSASLPSLIFLELDYVVYKDDDSLVRLLASCPILATLCVKRSDKDDNVTRFRVEMPNLSCLSYKNYRDGSGVGDTGRYLVIVTPALTHFDFRDSSGDSCSMELPGLNSAIIDTASYYPDDKFLRSLSSVSYLALFLTAAMVVCCSTIKFSRLIECEIVPEKTDWVKPTLLLLENSPQLKTLVIHCEYTTKNLPLSWIQPSFVPGCVSSQLEDIEWKGYAARDEEEEFLTYLLANSNCLKTATISLRLPACEFESTFELAKEMTIDNLKDIPRVSTESQLIIN